MPDFKGIGCDYRTRETNPGLPTASRMILP